MMRHGRAFLTVAIYVERNALRLELVKPAEQPRQTGAICDVFVPDMKTPAPPVSELCSARTEFAAMRGKSLTKSDHAMSSLKRQMPPIRLNKPRPDSISIRLETLTAPQCDAHSDLVSNFHASL
jgi:hypothetical protein